MMKTADHRHVPCIPMAAAGCQSHQELVQDDDDDVEVFNQGSSDDDGLEKTHDGGKRESHESHAVEEHLDR